MASIKGLVLQVVGFVKLYLLAAWAVIIQCFSRHVSINNNDLPNMEGVVAIVTGGSSGLGLEAVKSLAKAGAHVILACRSQTCADGAVKEIHRDVSHAKVDVIMLDLASLKSVRQFVKEFHAKNLPLHILINNAAVMIPDYKLTEDGFELQFGINYLGHFLLTSLLLDVLKKTGTTENPARVVNVASVAHIVGNINLDDLHSRKVYSAHEAYCQSKLAVVMSTYHLHRKLSLEGAYVNVHALHPGIVNTPLYRHVNPISQAIISLLGPHLMLTPRQGADTLLYLATSADVKYLSGAYYDNCQKVLSSSISYNRHLQDLLWEQSCHLVGISN